MFTLQERIRIFFFRTLEQRALGLFQALRCVCPGVMNGRAASGSGSRSHRLSNVRGVDPCFPNTGRPSVLIVRFLSELRRFQEWAKNAA